MEAQHQLILKTMFQVCSCISQIHSLMLTFGLGQIVMLYQAFQYFLLINFLLLFIALVHILLILLITELPIDDINCTYPSRLAFFTQYHIYEICFLCYIFQFMYQPQFLYPFYQWKLGVFLILFCFSLLLTKLPEYSCTCLFTYMCKNSTVYSQKLNCWVIEDVHLYEIMPKYFPKCRYSRTTIFTSILPL